jgi:hypothetical protein
MATPSQFDGENYQSYGENLLYLQSVNQQYFGENRQDLASS